MDDEANRVIDGGDNLGYFEMHFVFDDFLFGTKHEHLLMNSKIALFPPLEESMPNL